MANVIYADFMNLVGRVEALENAAAPAVELMGADERKALQDEIVRLRSKLEGKTGGSGFVLTAEEVRLRDALTAAEEQVSALRQEVLRAGDALAEERRTIDALQKDLAQVKVELEDARARLNAAVDVSKGALAERNDVRHEISRLRTVNDDLVARSHKDKAYTEEVEDANRCLRTANARLEGEVKVAQARVDKLEDAVLARGDTIGALQKELTKVKTERNDFEAKSVRMETANNELRNRVDGLATAEKLRITGLENLLEKKEEFILEQAGKIDTLVKDKREIREIADNNYKMYMEAKSGKSTQDLQEVLRRLEDTCAQRENALAETKKRVRHLEWVIRGIRTSANAVLLPDAEEGNFPDGE